MDDGIERPGPWYARQDADTRLFSASTRAWYKANLFHITIHALNFKHCHNKLISNTKKTVQLSVSRFDKPIFF